MNTDDVMMLAAKPLATAISDDDRVRESTVQTFTCAGKNCPRGDRPLLPQLAYRYTVIKEPRPGQYRTAGYRTFCEVCVEKQWESES